MNMQELFRPSYAQARELFRQASQASNAVADCYEMMGRGVEGEALSLDVAIHGSSDAPNILLTTSGVHGIEGYCGSAIQSGLLRQLLPPANVCVVHVHAVNPHGFSYGRRVNEDNVDLNRNFIHFEQPLPVNRDYALIHHLLLPEAWPPTPGQDAELAKLKADWGDRRMQLAVTGGQYDFPNGMFYGGSKSTWSQTVFRQVLRKHLKRAKRIAWIDLHTGLGPRGFGERIFACVDGGATLDRARAWWGQGITSVHAGSSTSIPMSGPIQMAMYEECPRAQYTGICLEFGTDPLDNMLAALRADHWMGAQTQVHPALQQSVRAQLRKVFNPDDRVWQEEVWRQGLQAAEQAVHGLSQCDA
jgi:hypothetical protein